MSDVWVRSLGIGKSSIGSVNWAILEINTSKWFTAQAVGWAKHQERLQGAQMAANASTQYSTVEKNPGMKYPVRSGGHLL